MLESSEIALGCFYGVGICIVFGKIAVYDAFIGLELLYVFLVLLH
ncbi:permease [Helicobacter bizzozeronii]|nr:permease [Helicobacter bizzozeronii]